jgi:hypothetical protein
VSSSAASANETGTRMASTQRPTVRAERTAALQSSVAPEVLPKRRWRVVAPVGVALTLGLGVGLLLRGGSAPSPAATASAQPSAVPVAVAPPVAPPAAPEAQPSVPVSAAAMTSAAAPAKKLVTSPARSAPVSRPRRGKNYDFGF